MMISERRFALIDQQVFAEASGDFNPIHTDPIAARRLPFGEPIVHGIHLVLWGLEQILADQLVEASGLEIVRLRANFKIPVKLGMTVKLVETRPEMDAQGFDILLYDKRAVSCLFEIQRVGISSGFLPPTKEDRLCKELAFEDLTHCQGEFDLRMHHVKVGSLFPTLSKYLHFSHLATILTCSRLVGMECPGMHSLFSDLELKRRDEYQRNFAYACTMADDRFQLVKLEVSSTNLHGQLSVFVRPPPIMQNSSASIIPMLQGLKFKNEIALCIGGSRGLGEAMSKILAMMGADVILTYRCGRDDAAAVVDDIRDAGGQAEAWQLDVMDDASVSAFLLKIKRKQISYFSYFAAPLIEPSTTQELSTALLKKYQGIFVEGFEQLARNIAAHSQAPLTIFYPSTTFLDDGDKRFREYCVAKSQAEAICWSLEASYPHVRAIAPRLPQVYTDQTSRLPQNILSNAVDLLLLSMPKLSESFVPRSNRV
tara:strand:- start:1572 stop:3020 length:1449 start_codon:yes stop_codon:yes gene_type:complete